MCRKETDHLPVTCRINGIESHTVPVGSEYTMDLMADLSACREEPEDRWVFVLQYSKDLWENAAGIFIETGEGNHSFSKILFTEEENEFSFDYGNPYARKVNISLKNLKTPEGEQEAWLRLKVYLDSESVKRLVGWAYIELMKGREEIRILDFYPEDGAVYKGGKTELRWRLNGRPKQGQRLRLYENGREVEIESGSVSKVVNHIQKSSVYRLVLTGEKGGDDNERQTKVQVLPIFLKTFQPSADRKEGVVEVCCANQAAVDKIPLLTPKGEYRKEWSGESMYLEAENDRDFIRARLYASRKEEENIALFRKVIFCVEGMTVLHVSWENLVLTREDLPRAVAGKTLTLIDQKKKTETVFYHCTDEKDRNPGEWEMLIEGHSKETVDQDLKIKMEIREKNGTTRKIIL